jgi:hypothetical protein
MPELVRYLQERLDKQNMQNQFRVGGGGGFMPMSPGGNYYNPMMNGMNMNMMGGMHGMGMGGMMNGMNNGMNNAFNAAEWQQMTDPSSGGKYYTNQRTSESIWEQEFKQKMMMSQSGGFGMMGMMPQQYGGNTSTGGLSVNTSLGGTGTNFGTGQFGSLNAGAGGSGSGSGGFLDQQQPTVQGSGAVAALGLARANGSVGVVAVAPIGVGVGAPSEQLDQWIFSQSARLKLSEFFRKQAPERLKEVDGLADQYRGREEALFKEVCGQYNVPHQDIVTAYQTAVKELKMERFKAGGPSSGYNILGGFTPKAPGAAGSILTGGGGSGHTPVLTASLEHPPQKLSREDSDLRRKIEESRANLALANSASTSAPPPQVVIQGISEAAVQMMLAEQRSKHESELEKERATFRGTVSEKEGAISMLQSELQTTTREKTSIQVNSCLTHSISTRDKVFPPSACL